MYPDLSQNPRTLILLGALSRSFEIHLACVTDEAPTLTSWRAMHEHVAALAIEPISPTVRRLRALRQVARGDSITAGWFTSRPLQTTINQWARREHFDVALAVCSSTARYVAALPIPMRVVDLVDVDSRKWAELANTSRGLRRRIYAYEADRLARTEAAIAHQFDTITLTTEDEAEAYRQLVPWADVRVVPNGVDLDYFEPSGNNDQRTVAFCGALDYRPNVEALCWFAHRIWPRIKAGRPEARFRIVGRRPDGTVQRLARFAGVEVIGAVPDVRPYLRDAAAVIAPLHIARGVQNKVLEAMAMARATVVSPAAATGIGAHHEEDWRIARTAEDWLNHVRDLLDDPAAGQALGASARHFVETHHRWSDAIAPMADLLHGPQRVALQISVTPAPLRMAA